MRRVPDLDSPFQLHLSSLPRRPDGTVLWDQVFGRHLPLRIEVGVGNSFFLMELSRLEPDFNYLGFEVQGQRLIKFLRKVHRAGVENIRVLQQDAAEVLPALVASHSVDHVFLNFPDPWPKRRHGRRRFIRRESTELLTRLLRPGAGLSLRTDAPAYARQMLEVLDGCDELENLSGKGCFAGAPFYPFDTQFEARFKARGVKIYYLEYRRAGS